MENKTKSSYETTITKKYINLDYLDQLYKFFIIIKISKKLILKTKKINMLVIIGFLLTRRQHCRTNSYKIIFLRRDTVENLDDPSLSK